jgi:hypothetical protein
MDVLFMKYTGAGDKPSSDVTQIRRVAGVTIVNANLAKTLIVQVKDDVARCRLMGLPNWSLVTPQTTSLESNVPSTPSGGNAVTAGRYLRAVHK